MHSGLQPPQLFVLIVVGPGMQSLITGIAPRRYTFAVLVLNALLSCPNLSNHLKPRQPRAGIQAKFVHRRGVSSTMRLPAELGDILPSVFWFRSPISPTLSHAVLLAGFHSSNLRAAEQMAASPRDISRFVFPVEDVKLQEWRKAPSEGGQQECNSVIKARSRSVRLTHRKPTELHRPMK